MQMDRRAFLSLAAGVSTTGCVGFFGPKPTPSGPDGEPPGDATGYDDDRDPGFDGDPMRVVSFTVPSVHEVGESLPVSALVRNESEETQSVTIPIVEHDVKSGEVVDSVDFRGEVKSRMTVSMDVLLATLESPGRVRVTLGDPESPAAATLVRVE